MQKGVSLGQSKLQVGGNRLTRTCWRRASSRWTKKVLKSALELDLVEGKVL